MKIKKKQEDNYKHLMEAADFLGIESLSNQCRRFVVDRLKLNNCVDRYSENCEGALCIPLFKLKGIILFIQLSLDLVKH